MLGDVSPEHIYIVLSLSTVASTAQTITCLRALVIRQNDLPLMYALS